MAGMVAMAGRVLGRADVGGGGGGGPLDAPSMSAVELVEGPVPSSMFIIKSPI
jgi:hypothetical protein